MFIEMPFLKYLPATRRHCVILDALHATGPAADAFTGEIVAEVARRSGCHAIIGLVSREQADLNRRPHGANRVAVMQFRRCIRELLAGADLLDAAGQLRRPVLQLSIHGMKDEYGIDVEIGSLSGRSCSGRVQAWALGRFEHWAREPQWPRRLRVALNNTFCGDPSKGFHRHGEQGSGYAGYGEHFHTLQLEFANWLRKRHRAAIVEQLCGMVEEFAAGEGW
jgi:hypothetical protein